MAFSNFQNQRSKPSHVIFGPMNEATMTLCERKLLFFNWGSLQNDDINMYASNLNETITSIASQCIPNKHVRIRPLDPPWLSSTLKRQIRKRKRAYKRAKVTNFESHWKSFKKIRNKVTKLIRDSKQSHYDKIANKLKSTTLSSKDWWSTLKSFIIPITNSSFGSKQ